MGILVVFRVDKGDAPVLADGDVVGEGAVGHFGLLDQGAEADEELWSDVAALPKGPLLASAVGLDVLCNENKVFRGLKVDPFSRDAELMAPIVVVDKLLERACTATSLFEVLPGSRHFFRAASENLYDVSFDFFMFGNNKALNVVVGYDRKAGLHEVLVRFENRGVGKEAIEGRPKKVILREEVVF